MKKEKAKRWQVNEAVKALRDGDVVARLDLATRFPLFSTATEEEILDEITLMTARQVEIRMKNKLLATEETDNDVEMNIEPKDKPAKKEDTSKDESELIEQESEEVETEIVEEKTEGDDIEDTELDDLFND